MNERHHDVIRELLAVVGGRWRMVRGCDVLARAALGIAAVWTVSLASVHWLARTPIAAVLVGLAGLVASVVVALRTLSPVRQVPSDARVARFIEERIPSFDDRLVSAIDLMASERHRRPTALSEPLLADVAARADSADVEAILPSRTIRGSQFKAVAAVLLVAVVALLGRDPARQVWGSTALVLFPDRARLEVTPGDVRLRAGAPLTIRARLVGSHVSLPMRIETAEEEAWRPSAMEQDGGASVRTLEAVTKGFTYRVVAGPLRSAVYSVSVLPPPHVTRIDLEYRYPSDLRLNPRTEEDGGDIYAPAGTEVRLRVHTDRPTARAQLALQGGTEAIALQPVGPKELSGSLKVVQDDSYRIALVDTDGTPNAGDTEYFVRLLSNHPPEVHIVRPASDRRVTKLEEVGIEVQADDDSGIARLSLVYSVNGGPEKVVKLGLPTQSTTVTARHTLYLEDFDLQPGDLVSYYARARDDGRGAAAKEGRSDIFFLEVRPFEQEFTMAQSQAMAGGGSLGLMDDLIAAQKQVVLATWKLDGRRRDAKGTELEPEVRATSRAEAELKGRVDLASGAFRESTMRDPKQPRGGVPPDVPAAGRSMPEEDEMSAAGAAMSRAVASLNAMKVGEAVPPEMEALNHLLKAQANVKKRQLMRQPSGAGAAGNNNRNYDISTLFDKELRRTQQTNYETRTNSNQSAQETSAALDRIRELARRQDELLKRQQTLDRAGLNDEQVKRELEQLTREQSSLRQEAEEIARQMSAAQKGEPASSDGSQGSNGGSPTPDSGKAGQGSRAASSARNADRMRDVSREMGDAVSNLRRQDTNQASAGGNRALEGLRSLERRLQSSGPDGRRRALGNLEFDARQLADAQRQLSTKRVEGGRSKAAEDDLRRLAGEQQRLADRAEELQRDLKEQGTPAAGASLAEKSAATAVGEVARDLEKQQLVGRMRKSAESMRASAGESAAAQSTDSNDPAEKGTSQRSREQADVGQDIARALDRAGDQIASANRAPGAESRRLSDLFSRAQQLRENLDRLGRELQDVGRQGDKSAQPVGTAGRTPSPGGQDASAQSGQSASQSGRGSGEPENGATGAHDVARLRDEYERRLRETRNLIEQARQHDQGRSRGGSGSTFEGQGMVLSAPGTEAFKQDFGKWEEMRRQATQALDALQSSLSKKLREQAAKERLAAGADDVAPAGYEQQVDNYFKALATGGRR